jgi:hypothetical protein
VDELLWCLRLKAFSNEDIPNNSESGKREGQIFTLDISCKTKSVLPNAEIQIAAGRFIIIRDKIMGLFDFLKLKKKQGLYAGGNGESIETAVIINTANSMIGISAEYKFITSRYGQKDVDWTREIQTVMRSGNRQYDVVVIKLQDGQEKSFYFDITKYYGKF